GEHVIYSGAKDLVSRRNSSPRFVVFVATEHKPGVFGASMPIDHATELPKRHLSQQLETRPSLPSRESI
ncbi:MAG: hypothetical protein ACPL7K_06385, partial [Armatimonadota bacterium]